MEPKIHNFPPRLRGNEQDWTKLTLAILTHLELKPVSLNVVFTDDQTLKQMHTRYLNDPSETDVITFDLGEESAIEGEIYISIERAEDQARTYGVTLDEEVLRLIIHGLLHLQGYDDLQEETRKIMKEQEDSLVAYFKGKLRF